MSSGKGATELPSSTVEMIGLEPSGLWVLDVQGADAHTRVPVTDTPTVVGSGPKAGLRVGDCTVSAAHCRIRREGSRLVVEDLDSTNGTFVGNARVERAMLGVGAVVSIGRTTITVSDGEDESSVGDARPLPGLAGQSPRMLHVAAQVRRIAAYTSPVLVAGETGSGKELVARALHELGPRADRPFVAINVAALPRELVESELFGHERGAFTGAQSRKSGAFQQASGGTLFLDEIGELPLDAQPKLLRALDGYGVRRVGGSGSGETTDVRIVTASHVPLEERVSSGRFRRDLFHRLEVFVVELPPLRERRGDITPIARRLLWQAQEEIGKRALTPSAVARLVAHDWPGNVRELRNVLMRAADIARTASTIDAVDIDRAIAWRAPKKPMALTPQMAKSLLDQYDGNLSRAARAAGFPRTSFRKLVAKCGWSERCINMGK